MITSKVVLITPELAQRILGNNPYNRNISRSTVHRYADLMRKGKWHENGESICIDKDGNLVNGQHRLAACIESGRSFMAVIVYGVEKDDSFVYDIGMNRSKQGTAIIAQKQGVVPDEPIYRSNEMLAIASYILTIKKSREITGKYDKIISSYSKYVTAEDCIEYISKHKNGFEFICNFRPPKRANKTRKASIWAAILQAYESGYEYEKLSKFCKSFTTGIIEDNADIIVIKLRDLSLSHSASNETDRKMFYMTTQYLLAAYEKGNVRARVKEADKEIYTGAY